MKEVFRQKLIVSNIILTVLDHLKSKIFFVIQPWWPTQSTPFFKISESAPGNHIYHTAQKMKLSADLVTFTGEIFNGKLHFLRSANNSRSKRNRKIPNTHLQTLIRRKLVQNFRRNIKRFGSWTSEFSVFQGDNLVSRK